MKLAQQLHERIKKMQFERFWPMIGNKVCKADALRAWLKMIDTQEDLDTCLANTPKWEKEWASWPKDRTPPYPATYLNREQWRDPPPWAQKPEPAEPPADTAENRLAVAKLWATMPEHSEFEQQMRDFARDADARVREVALRALGREL